MRNDFTMQHETGPLAIACHDRCARFHILALHEERATKGFSVALEEQQLMNSTPPFAPTFILISESPLTLTPPQRCRA